MELGIFEEVNRINFAKDDFVIKGKFKFSKSGNLIAMQGSSIFDINIYDSSHIVNLLDKIKNNDYIVTFNNQHIKHVRQFTFSSDDKKLFVATDQRVFVYDIQQGRPTQPFVYAIPSSYELLLTLKVWPDGSDGYIICKKEGVRVADVIQLSKISQSETYKSIQYSEPTIKDLRAKIASDGKKVFLNNAADNILFEDEKQIQIRWFGDKNVYKMLEWGGGFLCMTNREYDDYITILHTHQDDFKVRIPRQVTPGNIERMDWKIFGDVLAILISRDGELFKDVIDLTNRRVETYYDAATKSIDFKWPYLDYVFKGKEIILFSGNNPNLITRIPSPAPDQVITETFISDLNELFVVTMKGQDLYFQSIYLDKIENGYTFQFKYNLNQVKNQPLTGFWAKSTEMAGIRAGGGDDDRFFLLHQSSLYTCRSNQTLDYLNEVELARQGGSGNDNLFFKLKGQQEIQRVMVKYSDYIVDSVYHEKKSKGKIHAFSLDTEPRIFILTSKLTQGVREYSVVIVDTNTLQVTYKIPLHDSEIAGYFRAGVHFLVNGIFHFQNTLVRMNPFDSRHEVLTQYDEVIQMGASEAMVFLAPKASVSYRRILYVKQDEENFSLKTVVILPFLDERRIVFNTNDRVPQFCTLIHENDDINRPQKILCINPTKSRFEIYSIKGQLVNTVSTKDYSGKYGDPIAVSPNGKNLLFKGDELFEFSLHRVSETGPKIVTIMDVFQKIQKDPDLIELLSDRLTIAIEEIQQKYKTSVQINDNFDIIVHFKEKKKHVAKKIGQLMPKHNQTRKMNYGSNDQLTEGVGGRNKVGVKDNSYKKKKKERSEYDRRSVFMYFKGPDNLEFNVKDFAFDLLDKIHEFKGFSYLLSQSRLFFWNKFKVYYADFKDPHRIQTIAFEIEKEKIQRYHIKNLYCQNENEAAIQVSLTPKLDTIIIWDVLSDKEQDSYDVSAGASVVYDAHREIYILDEDYVIPNSSGGRCFSYQLDHNYDPQYQLFSFDRGHKVDSESTNFIVIRNHVNIGQSFLGVVASENLRRDSQRNFDPACYPYYVNRTCELHDLALDAQGLEQLLTFYEDNDSRLLDHLLIVNKQENGSSEMPLHYAVKNDNHKSINVILKKLRQVRVNNSYNFRDIFDDLLDYAFFQSYLDVCYFQTLQMKSIQSLSIKKKNDNSAIVVAHTNTLINQDFMDQVTHPSNPNQPVAVKGFDLSWILGTKDGAVFLLKLSQSQNVHFFTTEFIKTLIYFLWSHYRNKVLSQVMLPFCASFGFFIALVFFNERYFVREPLEYFDYEYEIMLGLCVANYLLMAYFCYVMARQVLFMKQLFFQSAWTWLTVFSTCLNLTVVSMTLSGQYVNAIRRIEAVAVILTWFRFLYFLRILDRTAPLIRMITQTLFDMTAFIVIFILFILGFANGFFVLAQNQQQLTEGDIDIPYQTYDNSIIYVYLTSIGEFQYDVFNQGDERAMLWGFLIITTFLLTIVLLNMLIAIMGQTFNQVSEVAEATKLKERLQLIIENFFLSSPKVFSRVKYLISIAPVQQESDDDSAENKLDEIQKELRALIKANHEELKNMIAQISNSGGGGSSSHTQK